LINAHQLKISNTAKGSRSNSDQSLISRIIKMIRT
jgi:hypothetical protein